MFSSTNTTTTSNSASSTSTNTPETKETKKASKSTLGGHPAVLVDVDGTLIINDQLNTNLVNALKKTHIKKIHLFTRMQMEDIGGCLQDPDYFSRPLLIEMLKKEDIQVANIFTIADASYKEGKGSPGVPYNELYLPQYKRMLNKELTKQNLGTDELYLEARAAFKNANDETLSQAEKRNLSSNSQDHTSKSILLSYLRNSIFQDNENIIVIDDDRVENAAINKTGLAGTIQVTSKSDQSYFESKLSECLSDTSKMYLLAETEYKNKIHCLVDEMKNIRQICKKSLSFFGSKSKDLMNFEDAILELIKYSNKTTASFSDKYFSLKMTAISIAEQCSDKIAKKTLDSIFDKVTNMETVSTQTMSLTSSK